MKKIILLLFILLITGCNNKSNTLLYDVVNIGDYVDYPIGNYSNQEIGEYNNESRPKVHGEFSFYGISVGDSKSDTVTKGCYSDNFNEYRTGFRVISKKNGSVILVHAGIPLCYYHASGLRAKESVEKIDKFMKSIYFNEEYAQDIRGLKCEDVTIDETCNFEDDNINIPNDLYRLNDYYFFTTKYDNIRLWNYEVFIDDFGRSHDISFGVRPVIILKSDVLFINGTGEQNNPFEIAR